MLWCLMRHAPLQLMIERVRIYLLNVAHLFNILFYYDWFVFTCCLPWRLRVHTQVEGAPLPAQRWWGWQF
jgi:hypothetical protein